MTIYRDSHIDGLKLSNTAVALGEFEAVHMGHTAIIEKAAQCAKSQGLKSLVFMFENSPSGFISNTITEPINTLEKRFKLLEALGVDIVVAVRFDKNIMDMPRSEFFEEYLVRKFDARFLSVGFNYRFGKNGEGDTKFLAAECEKRGIELSILPEVSAGGETVSSTRIRKLIAEGDMETAEKLLGRPFSIEGTIIKGNQIGGKVIGFPTANMELSGEVITPKLGVYISKVWLDGKRYPAITNVGGKPTVAHNHIGIETHIIGEEFPPLYGKRIEVELCRYIREIAFFDSTEALSVQLKKDRETAEKYFAE